MSEITGGKVCTLQEYCKDLLTAMDCTWDNGDQKSYDIAQAFYNKYKC